jgi:phosphoglycerate dehydrogenase-like enzyme
LLELPKVIITPHIAYYTRDSVEKMYEVGLKAIDQFLNNEELENKVVGY